LVTDIKPDERTPALRAGQVTALVGALCLLYAVSQFLRSSLGVLAPELSRELALEPEALGLLSSAFFLSFALAQLPLGVLLDRYGPKRAMLGSLGLALAGIAVFAAATSLNALVLGRMLMGLGCSSFLMGPLLVYARWFPPARFSTLAGIQVGVGLIGTLLATAPLAYGAAALGWRATFGFVAAAAALAGLLALLFVRDRPPGPVPPSRPETLSESVRGIMEAARLRDVGPLIAIHFASYASLFTVLGLWGGPYLTDVYGVSLQERGELLLPLAVANAIGTLAWGPVDRWVGSRKLPVVLGAGATAAGLSVLALSRPPLEAIPALFFALGFANGYISIQMAHGRALFPDRLVGRGMTILNMATMTGTFCLQLATGFAVGLFAADETGLRPLAAYQAAFGLAALMLVAALGIYLKAADRPPG